MERPVTRDESLVNPCRAVLMPRRLFGALAVVGLSLAATGCGMFGSKGPPPREAVPVTGSMQAASDLNPSVSQRPSPLTIRVYELKSSVAFDQADFMAIYRGDQAALGVDVISREEITLQPGETRPYDKVLNAETRFLAVFGAYRNLEKASWRAISPVPQSKKLRVSIKAEALAVSVQVTP